MNSSYSDIQRFCDNIGSESYESAIRKGKRFNRRFWLFFAPCIISLCIGMSLFFPIFSNRSGLDMLMDTMHRDNAGVKMVADEQVIPQPYIYTDFIKPVNSFGMGNTTFKNVNISFYRSWLNDTIQWSLEKSVDNVHWSSCDKLLTVEKDWDEDSLSEKHTLIIGSDEDA